MGALADGAADARSRRRRVSAGRAAWFEPAHGLERGARRTVAGAQGSDTAPDLLRQPRIRGSVGSKPAYIAQAGAHHPEDGGMKRILRASQRARMVRDFLAERDLR